MRYTGEDRSDVSSTAQRAAERARHEEEEREEDEGQMAATGGKPKESVEDTGVPPLQKPSLAGGVAWKAI